MLIKTRRANGDAAASLNDFDRKNLGDLGPQVETLLTLDTSHPGKLRAIGGAVNPAKHDDAVPAAGVLKVAPGDLSALPPAASVTASAALRSGPSPRRSSASGVNFTPYQVRRGRADLRRLTSPRRLS